MKPSKIPQQVISLVTIAVLAIAALVAARIMLVPKSFGKYGHYRADAVTEIGDREIFGFEPAEIDVIVFRRASDVDVVIA